MGEAQVRAESAGVSSKGLFDQSNELVQLLPNAPVDFPGSWAPAQPPGGPATFFFPETTAASCRRGYTWRHRKYAHPLCASAGRKSPALHVISKGSGESRNLKLPLRQCAHTHTHTHTHKTSEPQTNTRSIRPKGQIISVLAISAQAGVGLTATIWKTLQSATTDSSRACRLLYHTTALHWIGICRPHRGAALHLRSLNPKP